MVLKLLNTIEAKIKLDRKSKNGLTSISHPLSSGKRIWGRAL